MLIRVDPVILKQNSGSMSGIGSSLNNLGQSTSGIAQGAPSYDGQFGPRVQAIGHEALARAQELLNEMNNLSSQLQSKAQAFEAADLAGAAGFTAINNGAQISILDPNWIVAPIDYIKSIINLGRLFRPAPFFGPIGTLLVGIGLFPWNGQIGSGSGMPIRWPLGIPWPYGGKQPVKPPSPSIQPIQAGQEKVWTETEIKNQILGSQGVLPLDNGKEQCVDWAQKRREELGATILPAISIYSPNDWGAHNYTNIFKDSIIHITANDVSGSGLNISGLKTGAAIVWDKGNATLSGTAGYTYGHIAIVEAVQPDGVWVSQANWPGEPVMFIPKANLPDLYVIPPNATI